MLNSNSVTSICKRQRNIYDTWARLIKLNQTKGLGWNNLTKVRELKYEKDTITHQASSKRD